MHIVGIFAVGRNWHADEDRRGRGRTRNWWSWFFVGRFFRLLFLAHELCEHFVATQVKHLINICSNNWDRRRWKVVAKKLVGERTRSHQNWFNFGVMCIWLLSVWCAYDTWMVARRITPTFNFRRTWHERDGRKEKKKNCRIIPSKRAIHWWQTQCVFCAQQVRAWIIVNAISTAAATKWSVTA